MQKPYFNRLCLDDIQISKEIKSLSVISGQLYIMQNVSDSFEYPNSYEYYESYPWFLVMYCITLNVSDSFEYSIALNTMSRIRDFWSCTV
jgi:hypothetical protein